MVTKDTKLIIRNVPRNSPSNSGQAIVKVSQLFGVKEDLSEEERIFLSGLNYEEFTEIPYDLVGPTTYKNFRSFVKLA